ncbi:MAG: putative O-glycosylation ligase, exosortase A system-associated [Pseudomonadota bacterium]
MLSLRDIVLIGVIAVLVPFILKRPWIGILAWSWIGFMNPHRLAWGIMHSAPVAMVIGLLTILAYGLSREPKRLPITFLSGLMIVYCIWMSITTIFALVPDDAFTKWDKAIKVMIGVFLTLALMYTRERITLLICVIVGSIGFYSVKGGIFTVLSGGNNMVFGPAGSFFASNNALALATIMVIPLMRYLHLQLENQWIRLGMIGAIGLSIISVVGSYSRGAFLALSAMLFVLIIKSPRRGILLCAAFFGAVIALAIVPDKWYDRMHSITTYEEDGSAQGRFEAWRYAYEVAKERPFTGGGFLLGGDLQRFLRLVPGSNSSRAAHSIYFEVLGEHGFIGLAIFLLIGATALLTGTWVISRTKNRPDLTWASHLAAMLQVSMVGYAVGGAFLSQALFDLYWVMVVIMIQLKILVQKELAFERAALKESFSSPQRRQPHRIQPATARTPSRPEPAAPTIIGKKLGGIRSKLEEQS